MVTKTNILWNWIQIKKKYFTHQTNNAGLSFQDFLPFYNLRKRNIGATPNEIRKKGEESRDTPSLETYSVSAND